MKYSFDSNKPLYLQLYEQIKNDIISGAYEVGSKLPSKRTLAAESGMSAITIEHAYGLLAEEGYVEARERSGYFVTFKAGDGFTLPTSPITDYTFSAQSDNSPRFPFSVLCKTMRKVMSEYDEAILNRSPNKGLTKLRKVISNYLMRNRGICASYEQIVIGSGAEYLYGLIVSLLTKDKFYGIEYPSYEKIEKVYTSQGVSCQLLPLTIDGIDSSALSKTSAHVLHITPYRSFPTGITASASKRHEYVRWAENGRYLVEDDFESEFSVLTKPEETLFSLSKSDNVFYLNTFSKTISPSLRIGYMVLPKNLVNAFDDKLGFYSCPVPTFEQLVLTELISSGDFERHINRVRRKKRKDMSANQLR
ncbi:MAG: PLP-dependent aminotransferase family protein [Clostridia bacterium]|nr:PLP-dependent aminotransferase family protein [Clostridia bacterium]